MSTGVIEVTSPEADAYAMGDGDPWSWQSTYVQFAGIKDGAFEVQTIGGWIFNNTLFKSGDTINQANFRLYCWHPLQNDMYGLLAGHLDYTPGDFLYDAKPDWRWINARTTAEVAWHQDNVSIGYNDSPDVATIVQEIMDFAPPGYAIPPTILLLTESPPSATKIATVYMADAGAGSYPQLYVDYTAASAGGNVPEKMRSYRGRRQ